MNHHKNAPTQDNTNQKIDNSVQEDEKLVEFSKVVATTSSSVHNVAFQWTIEHFSTYYRRNKAIPSIISPKFGPSTSDELEFRLLLYTDGQNEEFRNYIALYLYPNNISAVKNDPTRRIKVSFSLLKSNGEKCRRQTAIDELLIGCGMPKYISRKTLFDHSNELLPDDKLTVICEVTAYVQQFSVVNNSINVDQTGNAIMHAQNQLAQDIGTLFADPKLSDVTLAVGDHNFAAHKNILSARSPVFSAMFQHDLTETMQNIVNIIDVDAEVFEVLLRFIYSGKVATEEVTIDLMIAADKALCEYPLSNSLTIETVAQTLLLADMHSANHLKSKCIEFINNNSAHVFLSDGWKELSSARPQLIVQLYQDSFNDSFPSYPATKKQKTK